MKWSARFLTDLAKSIAPAGQVFKCYIEPWEGVSNLTLAQFKERTVQFQLQTKYIEDGDIFLYDEGEDNDGGTYKDHRKIIDLDWVNRVGWQVVTCLVGSEEDSTQNRGYLLNSTLPPLIHAGNNPRRFMELTGGHAA